MPFPHRFLRPLTRAGAAMLLSVGLAATALSAVAGAGPVSHAEPVTSAEPVTTPQPSLTLAPTEPVLEPSQNRFEFTVRLDNPGEETIPAGSVDIELRPERLETVAELSEPFPDSGTAVARADIGEVSAQDSQSATVTVRSDEFPLTASDQPGVYLLQAVFSPAETAAGATDVANAAEVSGSVPVVWRGAAPPAAAETTETADPGSSAAETASTRTGLGLIIPLVLPSSVRTMPSPAELDEAVPNFEALLDVAVKARATIAIDPRIIASIRAYGDNASDQSREFLKRLESTALPSFLLQFADADPAAQSAIGLTELLQPTTLEYLTSQGSFPASGGDSATGAAGSSEADGTNASSGTESTGTESTGTESPGTESTGTESPGDSDAAAPDDAPVEAVPTLAELLAWPQQTQATAWPAENQVDSATIALLQDGGITNYVLSSGNVSHEGGPRAKLDAGHALIADDALGSSVRQALGAEDETDRMAAVSTASAQLALTAQHANSGLLLALDRGAIADAEDPAALIEQLISPSWIEATAVQALPEGTASLRSASTLEERRELLRSATKREADVNSVSVLLQNPADLTGYQRARLLSLFATRYAEAGSDFARAAKQYASYDKRLRTGVQIVSAEHTQLVGTSTRVPLQLRNYLPFEAVVSASVFPSSAALSVAEREFTDITVAAGGNGRVLVPVRSRVSSGESGLSVQVTDPSGEFVSDSKTLPITIRSGIETIGLWTLAVLATLLLIFGTVRSIRRRRRRRSKIASSETAETHAEAAE